MSPWVEALNVVLVTADARLSRASGIACEIEVLGGADGC
jgi:predicted nucleic acid-binding protein